MYNVYTTHAPAVLTVFVPAAMTAVVWPYVEYSQLRSKVMTHVRTHCPVLLRRAEAVWLFLKENSTLWLRAHWVAGSWCAMLCVCVCVFNQSDAIVHKFPQLLILHFHYASCICSLGCCIYCNFLILFLILIILLIHEDI